MSNSSHDSSHELMAVFLLDLRFEQRERWEQGERVFIESLLERHPAIAEKRECMLELLYSEFCLREELGENPDPHEYFSRFPQYEDRLSRLFEVHRALDKIDPNELDAAMVRQARPTLVLTRTGVSPNTWCREFTAEPQIVGRQQSADIPILDHTISKRHCRVWKDDQGYHIEDCSSTNGTIVNGKRVAHQLLNAGDRIRIGKLELTVRDRDELSAAGE